MRRMLLCNQRTLFATSSLTFTLNISALSTTLFYFRTPEQMKFMMALITIYQEFISLARKKIHVLEKTSKKCLMIYVATHKRPLSHNLMKEYEAVMASDFVTAIYAFMTAHNNHWNWNSLQQALHLHKGRKINRRFMRTYLSTFVLLLNFLLHLRSSSGE